MARIKKVIQGVHMAASHRGLAALLKKDLGLDVEKLEAGDLVMCLNTKGDKMKVIGGRGMVIGYLKTLDGSVIMKEAIQYLPATFGGSGFNYDAAVKKALEDRFRSMPRLRKTVSPLQAAKHL